MTSSQRFAACLLALALCGPVLAQATQPKNPAPAASVAAAGAAARARPRIVVIEDDGVRIEEVHVRGAVKSITVQSKVGGARPYEIQVAPAGRDPSQERGNAGRRSWSVFDF